MLDDLKYISRVDKDGALDITEDQPEQLGYNFKLNLHELKAYTARDPIENIIYCAMGGSALAASISITWPGYRVPFEIVRNYALPDYVNHKSLCIISSYSGNTEETLSALSCAEAKNAKIIIITGGGQLADIAKAKNYPLILLPNAQQPRYGVFYNLKALVSLGHGLQVLKDNNVDLLEMSIPFLREIIAAWLPTSPIADNLAKQIALDCLGKSVVIYAGPKMYPVAYKWKISFNENAKHVAWCNAYPEFNHNEFIGWSQQPNQKPYQVIDLRSDLELKQIQTRFALSEKLLSGKRPTPTVINAAGANIVEQMLSTIVLGDFASIYAAIASNINPSPVDLVENFKKQLANA